MKVVHLSFSDIQGGAARAAYRLHLGLRSAGVQSGMLVEQKATADSDVRVQQSSGSLLARVRRRLRRRCIERDFATYQATRPAGLDLFSDDRSRHGDALLTTIGDGLIVNLHWVARLVDYLKVLPKLAERFPLVWTLHDMNVFTGGCHYTADCLRYTTACARCPQLGSQQEHDLSHAIWHRKQEAFAAIPDSRMTIVCPSNWLADCVGKSSLLSRFPRQVIPNGVALDSFAPRNKQFARQLFGIPEAAQVLLFVADYDNRRKGFRFLLEALKHADSGFYMISVGEAEGVRTDGLRRQTLGRITDDRLLSLAYSAADLFVCPSTEDNLPNTVLEAFACGTPVVSFNVGGIPDMVRPGQTGWLAEKIDADSLRGTIQTALAELRIRGDEISRSCREVAENEYSLELQARRYLEVYRQMTQDHA